MNASVGLFIAANGPNYTSQQDVKRINEYRDGYEEFDEPAWVYWAPGENSDVMPYQLWPLLEAAERLKLQNEEELRKSYLDACQRLFPETFGAPLSYAEAWQAILESEVWINSRSNFK